MGCYNVVSYLDAGFLQMFLWERFPPYAPSSMSKEKSKRGKGRQRVLSILHNLHILIDQTRGWGPQYMP